MAMKQKTVSIVFIFLCLAIASCDKKEYDVTIDYGFGQVETTTYEKMDEVTIPKLENKNDYFFMGWTENQNVEPTYVSYTFFITSNKTFYAVWKKKGYVWLYDGVSSSKDYEYAAPEGYEMDLSSEKPTVSYEPYYSFLGWSTDGTEDNILSQITLQSHNIRF